MGWQRGMSTLYHLSGQKDGKLMLILFLGVDQNGNIGRVNLRVMLEAGWTM